MERRDKRRRIHEQDMDEREKQSFDAMTNNCDGRLCLNDPEQEQATREACFPSEEWDMTVNFILSLLLCCLVSCHVDVLTINERMHANKEVSWPANVRPAMRSRGGGPSDFGLDPNTTEIVLEDEDDSSEIIGEGTAAPGPGVQVQEGYIEEKNSVREQELSCDVTRSA